MDIITYALLKKYIDGSVQQTTGKSAYEIAVENGYTGTQTEWLDSLKGKNPSVGTNGNWWVGDEDTGIKASSCECTSIQDNSINSLFTFLEEQEEEKL